MAEHLCPFCMKPMLPVANGAYSCNTQNCIMVQDYRVPEEAIAVNDQLVALKKFAEAVGREIRRAHRSMQHMTVATNECSVASNAYCTIRSHYDALYPKESEVSDETK